MSGIENRRERARGRQPASKASLTGGQDVFHHRKHQGQAESTGRLGSCLPGMVESCPLPQNLPSALLQHAGSSPTCHSLCPGKVLILKQGWGVDLHTNSLSIVNYLERGPERRLNSVCITDYLVIWGNILYLFLLLSSQVANVFSSLWLVFSVLFVLF